jgi:hypothetical protein
LKNDYVDILANECAVGAADLTVVSENNKCKKDAVTAGAPICNLKGDYTLGTSTWGIKDYGMVCDASTGATAAACTPKCTDNTV